MGLIDPRKKEKGHTLCAYNRAGKMLKTTQHMRKNFHGAKRCTTSLMLLIVRNGGIHSAIGVPWDPNMPYQAIGLLHTDKDVRLYMVALPKP